MEKAPPFVVPSGVVFEIADDGVTIENRGDVVLHTNFGRGFKSVVSTEGSVELHGDVRAGRVAAAGGVVVHGSLTADEVEAGGDLAVGGAATLSSVRSGGTVEFGDDVAVKVVHAAGAVTAHGAVSADAVHSGGVVSVAGAFNGGLIRAESVDLAGAVTARGIQAARLVTIGPVKVSVDAIIAHEVALQPKTTGRAAIIECQNDLGPNAVKGCFRLADWEETFGDPTQYLADRGLNAPGDAPPPVVVPVPAAPPVAPPPPVVEPAPAAVEPTRAVVVIEPEPEPEPVPVVAGPVSIALDVEIDESEDAPPAPPEAPLRPLHPLHPDLVSAVARIIDCYPEADVPPAVTHLHELIEERAYDQVRAEITTIWSDLLKFHKEKGLRIQHQVTTTFNTINSIVKKM